MTGEWEDQGGDGEFYIKVHVPCGTKIQTLAGFALICPKCQSAEFGDRDRVGRELRARMEKHHQDLKEHGPKRGVSPTRGGFAVGLGRD